MAQIFLALNFGEMGALESAENSDFFHVRKNLYGAVHILRNAVGGEGGFPRPLLIVTGRGVGGQECVT